MLSVLAFAAALAGSQEAKVISARPDAVAVTIYRNPANLSSPEQIPSANGRALITETRTVQLPAGRSRIVFQGVSDGMLAPTARMTGLHGQQVERNFDYDLLSPASLLAKSVGQAVTLVQTNPATGAETRERAVLRSAGRDVALDFGGGLEALHCGGPPQRLEFDRVPPGLGDKPSLSIVVNASAAGAYVLTLSYLARGFGWQANYVASLSADERTLDLSASISLINQGSVAIAKGPVQVVAGRWNRVFDPDEYDELDQPGPQAPECFSRSPPPEAGSQDELVVTGSRMPVTGQLGDYKLYELPEPTELAAAQVKQVALLARPSVSFERFYSFDVLENDDDMDSTGRGEFEGSLNLRLTNDTQHGLGLPLPGGGYIFTQRAADGANVVVGEAVAQDAAVGSALRWELGLDPLVRIRARSLGTKSFGSDDHPRQRTEWEVRVRNDRPEPIDFDLSHGFTREHGAISKESLRHHMISGYPAWSFHLKPGEARTVRYQVEEDEE